MGHKHLHNYSKLHSIVCEPCVTMYYGAGLNAPRIRARISLFYKCTQTLISLSANRKPSMDDNADPSDGLMNMLKKIYSEGDDEMKRTINKAWSESQEKKIRGEGMMDF